MREKYLCGRGIRALRMIEDGAEVEDVMRKYNLNRGQTMAMLREARARKHDQRHGYTKNRRAK